MKKSFKALVVIAAAAFTLASCEKQEVNMPSASERTITLNFNAMPLETKTAFGEKEGTTYPTLWTETSTLQASLNFAGAKSATITPSADNKTATFTATFTAPEEAPESYDIYAVSPKFLGVSSANSNFSFEIPTAQTPTEASVDEAAQFIYGTASFDALPGEDEAIDLNFTHLTAYGKMTIKDEAVIAAGIKSVSLTASAPIAGRWNYSPAEGALSENSTASTITLETTSAEGIWFAIAPADLSAGTLKVTVVTDAGNYEKTIDFTGTGKGNFKAGTVASFGVKNFTKAEEVVYNLVTDVTDLTPNSVVIIAAAASDVAISTTQNGNNRGQAAVTKGEGTILNPAENVETFIVETGASSGTYAFNAQTAAGYLYASGGTSGNQLRTKDELDAFSSWTVTIAEDGVATVICSDAATTRNWMRYNSGSSCFACYASTSSQKDIAIYKLEGSGDAPVELVTITPEQTEVSFTAEGGTSDEIFIEFDGESCDLTASVDVSWITLDSETIADGDGVIFTVAENATSSERIGVITLSAPTVKPATITVTQEAGEGLPVLEVTVAEFLAAEPSVEQKYQLTGTITSIANTTYGNLYLEDETGSVYVYGLCATEQGLQDGATASSAKANNDKSFASLGLQVGDVLTLIGYRYTYNTTIQVLGGYYVSHETPAVTVTHKYQKATAVTSGNTYLFVADGQYAMTSSASNYGYPAATDVVVENDMIELGENVAKTVEFIVSGNATDGYTIMQVSDNRYLYQTGTYNSFNFSASPTSGQYFTFALNADDTFTVTNIAMSKYLQYSTSHTSYGSYSDEQGIMPCLYELVSE